MDQHDTGRSCLCSGFLCSVYGHLGHILLMEPDRCFFCQSSKDPVQMLEISFVFLEIMLSFEGRLQFSIEFIGKFFLVREK